MKGEPGAGGAGERVSFCAARAAGGEVQRVSLRDACFGSPLRRQFEELRERMIVHGAKVPPDPPEKVRAWTKTQGMDVAE